jgi:hypothetical protein
MQIDLTLVPTTFDAVHAGLAALVVLLLLIQVLLLSAVVISMLRKNKSAVVIEQRQPVPEVPDVAPAVPRPPRRTDILEKPAPPAPVVLREPTPDAALQLLGLLQQEARFIDFIEEKVDRYSDAEIGAAARLVHEGCHKVLHEHFQFEAVRQEAENSRVTLPKGFDASAVRLTGNIVGEPPFTGTLVHRGWRVREVKLPKLAEGHDPYILAAAEVEL